MKTLLLTGVVALLSSPVLAQVTASRPNAPAPAGGSAEGDARLATRLGHELSVSVGHYTYIEPGDQNISIHGPRIGGEYTGTLSLSKRKRLFVEADVRGSGGQVTYDGWCSPFFIAPNSSSPNGYELDLGDHSPCSETGDADWYLEGRALVGRDFLLHRWGLSPQTGLGVRHLSNGTTGLVGYRTDDYLYLPVGLTMRTGIGTQRALSLKLEYDALLHGWQTTRDSKLGGGNVAATPTAPAFSIDSFSDVSFNQHGGWALRASAKYQVTNHWSIEPSYVYWNVSASPVSDEAIAFTVNNITAHEQFGVYEPDNTTHEWSVNLGFHF